MDRTMIDRWRERVKPDDIVYHLGDFSITKADFPTRILAELPGKKILVLGNHDKSAARMMEFGFDFACESMTIVEQNTRLFLVHRPQRQIPPDTAYVLHGHIHNSTPEERAKHTAKGEIVIIPQFNINMCVEMWNYEPVTIRHILSKVRRGQ